MVLPLVDEDKPKCFLCHDTFDDYENLRKHQDTAHKDYFEYHERREVQPQAMFLFFRFL